MADNKGFKTGDFNAFIKNSTYVKLVLVLNVALVYSLEVGIKIV